MIFADTGYFIALLDSRDQLHVRARAWDLTVNNRIVTTHYVLLETVNYFSRPNSRAKVHTMIDFIRAGKNFVITPGSDLIFNAGLDLHRRRYDQEWSLTDCISFAVMQDRGITTALAFDHHFEQAGFNALLRHDPP